MREVLERLVRMSRAQGVETVAMHVGDEETIRILERERVDYAQGFHVGSPAAVTERLDQIVARALRHNLAVTV
jgi:EAL domain-containing protein (putative c-di-GMP-specific phosphodiesterase class I)